MRTWSSSAMPTPSSVTLISIRPWCRVTATETRVLCGE
jgi:hypothetical protein